MPWIDKSGMAVSCKGGCKRPKIASGGIQHQGVAIGGGVPIADAIWTICPTTETWWAWR